MPPVNDNRHVFTARAPRRPRRLPRINLPIVSLALLCWIVIATLINLLAPLFDALSTPAIAILRAGGL